MNRHISVKLYLKSFQSAISPTVLYGLCTIQLPQPSLQKLDAKQRKMLPSIAGWTKNGQEDFKTATQRVNQKLESCLNSYPIKPWSSQLVSRQFGLSCKISSAIQSWPARAVFWEPTKTMNTARHSQGRPRTKWDDQLSSFANSISPKQSNKLKLATNSALWGERGKHYENDFTN